MKPTLPLRIAAVLTLLYWAGHTLGMPWTPSRGPQEIAVLEAMKSSRFDVMGSASTYWNFYFGFGVAISGYLALQAVVLWQLAVLARRSASELRPIIAAFFLSFAVNALVVWKFFFAVPLVLAIVIAICLALAFISAKPSEPA